VAPNSSGTGNGRTGWPEAIALEAKAVATRKNDKSFIVGFRDQLQMYDPFNGWGVSQVPYGLYMPEKRNSSAIS